MKSILILGSTGGIGEAIAHSLAQKDKCLFLHGNSSEKLSRLKNDIWKLCGGLEVCAADLTLESEVSQLGEMLKKHRIDWIINAAGYIEENEKNNLSYSKVKNAFSVNIISPLYLSLLLIKNISDEGGVIMISSTASLHGNPAFPVYSSSKGAVNTFIKALSEQFKETNKKAINICPGGTNTTMRERVAQDAEKQQSPQLIAHLVNEIITKKTKFKNGDIILAKDGKTKKIETS